VPGSTYKFYVYSAFYENRPAHPFVRVIATTKTKMPGKAWCRVYYHEDVNTDFGRTSEQEQQSAMMEDPAARQDDSGNNIERDGRETGDILSGNDPQQQREIIVPGRIKTIR
jgi:hypothetical protein